MFRGTTPTHTFKLPFSTSLLQKVLVTYKQDENIVLEKTEADCTFENNSIKLKLTQEETLAFSAKRVKIQLKLLTTDGTVMASDIKKKFAKDCLNNEVFI